MSPIRMSRPESAIRVVLAFNEFFNRHEAAQMARLLSEDCIIEDCEPAPEGNRYVGRAAALEYFKELFDRARELTNEIEEIFGFGSRCVVRWKRGWLDADGKKQQVRGVDICEVKSDTMCGILSYRKGS